MRIKVYRAPSMAEAMRQVRHELGHDALILATRRVAEGVEVTAALEPEPPPPLSQVAQAPAQDPARARLLAWHGAPQCLIDRLGCGALEQALEQVLLFDSLKLDDAAPPILVTGPPGAGKTLTIARLATRLVLAGSMPLVISTDDQRAGAPEQLAAFCRLLGLEVLTIEHPATLARAVVARRGTVPVLIDTAGIDAFDAGQLEQVEALSGIADAQMVLVLPAGLDVAEAADLAEAYAGAGARHIVATRFDLSRRLGSVLAAAAQGKLALAEAGIGPGASDGLVPLTPVFLAERLHRAAPPPENAR